MCFINYYCSNSNTFDCNLCHKEFPYLFKLNNHLQKHLLNDKYEKFIKIFNDNFFCNICSYPLENKEEMYDHLVFHKVIKKCIPCNKYFI